MKPVVVHKPPLLLAGYALPLTDEAGRRVPAAQAIPEFTRAVRPKLEALPHRVGAERYAVIENDVIGRARPVYYTLVAVSSADDLPQGAEVVTVDAGPYAIFEHRGPARETSRTAEMIMQNWIRDPMAMLARDREVFVYQPGYDPTDPEGRFEWRFPLKEGVRL